ANAERLWFKTLGDTTGQEFSGRIYDVVELDDGRLAFAGSRNLSGQNAESFLLVTDAWGNGDYPGFEMDISAKETLQCQTCLLYPNPADEYIWVDPETKTEQAYTMYDVTGKPVKKGLVKGKTRLSLANLRPGMYIFKSEFCRSQRIVVN
ncbi:MAG: T9SS type A sorting domain-containing protein, partial [Bacteroidales bacterium]